MTYDKYFNDLFSLMESAIDDKFQLYSGERSDEITLRFDSLCSAISDKYNYLK